MTIRSPQGDPKPLKPGEWVGEDGHVYVGIHGSHSHAWRVSSDNLCRHEPLPLTSGSMAPMDPDRYRCPVCKGDENTYLMCQHPGCPDGRDPGHPARPKPKGFVGIAPGTDTRRISIEWHERLRKAAFWRGVHVGVIAGLAPYAAWELVKTLLH